jgi:hypothetical protein
MDYALVAVSMHGIERIAAVCLGGVAVYYGYKLFLTLPTQTESNGKIKLPGMSVVLSKAGPGLFFLAFGSLVILSSLFRPIEIKTPDGEYRGFSDKPAAARPPSRPEANAKRVVAETDVARVQLAVQSVNCMARLAGARAKGLGAEIDQSARESKLALLATVWQADQWGGFDEFERWAIRGGKTTSSAAKALFEAQRVDCPA